MTCAALDTAMTKNNPSCTQYNAQDRVNHHADKK